MAAPLCKFAVGKPGLGAAHASYITRLSALDPDGKRREEEPDREDHAPGFARDEAERRAPTVAETLDRSLDERAFARGGKQDQTRGDRDEDPIFTWNAPSFVTGDSYGIDSPAPAKQAKDVQQNEQMLAEKIKDKPWLRTDFNLREKIENTRAYFGSKEEFEKLKGGRTHYRAILSFDVPATNKQIRSLTTRFLAETFPKAMAFGAIHRDTDHPHVHVYIHARQTDAKKVRLTPDQYRTIDEKWAKIYSEFLKERSVYDIHKQKKEETRQWKIAAAKAYREGKPIPSKPDRDADKRERLAEQRLSASRSEARDQGLNPGSRPYAPPLMRPMSERETARLIAREHLARAHAAHLIRTDAAPRNIDSACQTAQALGSALERTKERRTAAGKTKLPAPAYTVQEAKALNSYHRSRFHDYQMSIVTRERLARLIGQERVASVEAVFAKRLAQGFEARRHLRKVEIAGWDRKVSLKDVEQALKEKKLEKLDLWNAIRAGKRATIGSHIDYLQEVKREIQDQIAERREAYQERIKAAELRHGLALSQIQPTIEQRRAERREIPDPEFSRQQLDRIAYIAERSFDPKLLSYVHGINKPNLRPDPKLASVMLAKSVLAQMEYNKAREQQGRAFRYFELRQIPIQDSKGRDHSVSIRDVNPRNLTEVITNRVIRSPEERFNPKEVKEAARQQYKITNQEAQRVREYAEVRDKVAIDYCRAARRTEMWHPPLLTEKQVNEFKENRDSFHRWHEVRVNRTIEHAEEGLKSRRSYKQGRRMMEKAIKERDGDLLMKGYQMAKPDIEFNERDASRWVGHYYRAAIEMVKAERAYDTAYERHRDVAGGPPRYSYYEDPKYKIKSEPHRAGQLSAEERQAAAERTSEQLAMSRQEYNRTVPFYNAVTRITNEYFHGSGKNMKDVSPELSAVELQQMRDELREMDRGNRMRDEFSNGAALGEKSLGDRERERERSSSAEREYETIGSPRQHEAAALSFDREQERAAREHERERDSGFRGR